MKRIMTLVMAVLLIALTVAAFAGDLKLGVFVPEGTQVRNITKTVPTAEWDISLTKTPYATTDLAFVASYPFKPFENNQGYFRAAASLEKRLTVGDPKWAISPYIGGGAGALYVSGYQGKGYDVGGSLIAGLKFGKAVTLETKWTKTGRTKAGDGYTVMLGAKF